MKKRFWTRLISAVLTMAMAFSILAVPASAASSENSWAIVTSSDDGSANWITEEGLRKSLQFLMAQQGVTLSDEMLEYALDEYKNDLLSEGEGVLREGNFPAGVCLGVTTVGGKSTKWYDGKAYEAILKAGLEGKYVETDYETGEIIIGDIKVPTTGDPGDSPVVPTPDPEPDPEPSKVTAAAVGVPVDGGETGFDETFSGLIAWFPVENGALNDALRARAKEKGWTIREGLELSTEMEFGFSQSADGKIFWYNEEMLEEIAVDWDEDEEPVSVEIYEEAGGLVFVSDKGNKAELTTDIKTPGMNEVKPAEPSGTTPSGSSSSSTSSAGGAGVAVAAAVGAAAVATGVYFYTHPEKVEEIKTFFADLSANVQAKVQEFTANVKGAFGIVPEQEDEEDAPVAETAEAAQAA